MIVVLTRIAVRCCSNRSSPLLHHHDHRHGQHIYPASQGPSSFPRLFRPI